MTLLRCVKVRATCEGSCYLATSKRVQIYFQDKIVIIPCALAIRKDISCQCFSSPALQAILALFLTSDIVV
jgi:hypothetical protein